MRGMWVIENVSFFVCDANKIQVFSMGYAIKSVVYNAEKKNIVKSIIALLNEFTFTIFSAGRSFYSLRWTT